MELYKLTEVELRRSGTGYAFLYKTDKSIHWESTVSNSIPHRLNSYVVVIAPNGCIIHTDGCDRGTSSYTIAYYDRQRDIISGWDHAFTLQEAKLELKNDGESQLLSVEFRCRNNTNEATNEPTIGLTQNRNGHKSSQKRKTSDTKKEYCGCLFMIIAFVIFCIWYTGRNGDDANQSMQPANNIKNDIEVENQTMPKYVHYLEELKASTTSRVEFTQKLLDIKNRYNESLMGISGNPEAVDAANNIMGDVYQTLYFCTMECSEQDIENLMTDIDNNEKLSNYRKNKAKEEFRLVYKLLNQLPNRDETAPRLDQLAPEEANFEQNKEPASEDSVNSIQEQESEETEEQQE